MPILVALGSPAREPLDEPLEADEGPLGGCVTVMGLVFVMVVIVAAGIIKVDIVPRQVAFVQPFLDLTFDSQ